MKTLHSNKLLTLVALATSLLLSACGDNIQSMPTSNKATQADGKIVESELTINDFDHITFDSSAHWLSNNIIVLQTQSDALQYQLLHRNQVGFETIALTPVDFPDALAIDFPHLNEFDAFSVDLSTSHVKRWLKNQLMVIATDTHNKIVKAAYVQTGAVIDDLYTKSSNDADEVNDLGASIVDGATHFKLWAPTAKSVDLRVFNEDLTPAKTSTIAMKENIKTGVWSVATTHVNDGAYYQYQISVYHPESKHIEVLNVTDPYSLSLSVNSHYSQVVDLNEPSTQPEGWDSHHVPTIANVEDNILYETHVRDFSSSDKNLSNELYRGKYKAFGEKNSDAIKHIKSLKNAGLNNIHLLPVYDIATVNEDANQVINLSDTIGSIQDKVCDDLSSLAICSSELNRGNSFESLLKNSDNDNKIAQQYVSELRTFDNFNWGYDPFHYTVPEGSYALEPKGKTRLIEFREMVKNIHDLGFRVIMDVVYNHTYQFGLKEKSVLDKVVPNYYHRLNIITGGVEQSTCYTCGNTATERTMMAKLMTDSLVVWARDYKIDGFRFDLMGHQSKAAVLAARDAVREVDADTYFYGEGWNFGEVANNKRFVQASQLELGGTEIGTYSDRLRDAVRGGGNNTRDSQGLGNGLYLQPNERLESKDTNKEYKLRMDQLRIGLTGNLAEFPLYQTENGYILGKDIPYGDQPTGYALDPADTINYVSKHDNQTLWDNNQYRLPFTVTTGDRVRMHMQSLSFTLYAQGIPFLHMGSEFLRSKSYLRDSYDYSDWFNRVDFSKQTNHYNIGLPPAEKDKDNWPLINEVASGHQGRDHVRPKHIIYSAKIFEEMLAIRTSSPLFRLTSAKDIIEKVSFLNTADGLSDNKNAGLLVMKIDDEKGKDIDSKLKSIVVIFNLDTKQRSFTFDEAKHYQLHSVLQSSIDERMKENVINEDSFSVPALSTVVFVKR